MDSIEKRVTISGRRVPINILDRPLSKGKQEVSLNAFAFLFAEIIHYAQKRSGQITEMEQKLAEFGQRVGIRVLELTCWREKNSRRETRLLSILTFIHTVVYKTLYGKQADSLERSTEADDEYYLQDNDPLITNFISVPKEFSSLNCNAFTAGVVEAILERSQFPAKVSAHYFPEIAPRRSTIIIKFEASVMERERRLDALK